MKENRSHFAKLLMSIVPISLALSCISSKEPTSSPPDLQSDDNNKAEYSSSDSKETDKKNAKPFFAGAILEARSGSDARGRVAFREHENGIMVMMEVLGIESPGPRGIHIHENGDCSADDASSAGDHFNPTDAKHGSPHNHGEHHFGDLGNIVVDESGRGLKAMVIPIPEGKDKWIVVDRSVILHANEDRYTQPAGDAGPRIACGVIRRLKP
jgi:superoxide dismutase, Cu-Zn family